MAFWLCSGCCQIGWGAESTNLAAAELKYERPKFLGGQMFVKGSETKLLFKFTLAASRSGNVLDVVREYAAPDGTLADREHVVYEGDALKLFELEERQIGAKGSAKIRADPRNPAKKIIEFEYLKDPQNNAKPKVRTEPLQDHALVGDMVVPFLIEHWDALQRGEKVKCRYIVVPRCETVGFTFVKESESTCRGREVIVVRMEPTSRILSALVDPVYFWMEKAAPHWVLQYAGRTTPKLQSGNKWKDLDAVTVFDWE